ncbi:TrlF family AAA-like ATPase [Flavobacterium sp.]|uniref:TrlF family AAA-like ATPase n=2 Tax=Flavobacterium sp. TaxID=239 RepID=UPI00338F3A96
MFSDELSIETIKSQFLNTLEQSYYLESGEAWTRAITPQSVAELGHQIKSTVPANELSKYGSDLTEGFNNLNIKEDKIFESLNKDVFKGKYLIAIGKTEWGELKWTDASIATKKSIINRADIIFTAAKSVEDFTKAKTQLTAQGVNDLLLDCSDAHYFSTATDKDRIGNCFTWIKSEPTFEGLKQILFEPKYRVFIGANAPINPPIRINKVTLDFPTDSKFENEDFCLSGTKEINFSPNFTCLIGGRGSGKSTILNLIHEKLKPGENIFFKTRSIKDSNGNYLPIDNHVTIDNDADEKYIEFLSQNEIEEFAQDYLKLTNAVYTRILKRDEHGSITLKETTLKQKLENFKVHIINLRRIKTLRLELEQKNRELETNKKLVNSFSSDEYKKLNEDLKGITTKLNALTSSSEQYAQILADLKEVVDKYQQTEPKNQHSIEVDRIVKGIETLILESSTTNFTVSTDEKAALEIELAAKKGELIKYLSDKGLTEENLKDISTANVIINGLEIDIEKRKTDITDLQRKIDDFVVSESENASQEYKLEIDEQIKVISEILENLHNASVKPISLNFEFDVVAATNSVFDDFKKLFESQIAKSNYKSDANLREILFSIEPNSLTDRTALTDAIKSHSSGSSAKSFLLELFEDESNFEVYKLLSKMTFLNYPEFKKVKVQYDNRPIENSSFGQRCTAVLVILLLLGNNPIIIDEPEAHLDSLLISNYLVEIIKDRKRSRQIIFATHNANFVINGDSELIHILNINPTTQKTVIESTTIENENTRETLIGLEGGYEAFKKRENKYQYK